MGIVLNNPEDFQPTKISEKIYDSEDFLEDEELQRTEDWLNVRNGKWSASMIKKLMSCNARGGKMDWANPRKALEFSEGALKSIYANAKARQRGYYIESVSGKSMQYGTKVEPLVAQLTKEYLEKQNLKFQKIGFVCFEDIPTAGVSSDFLSFNVYNQLIFNGEQKACVSWDSHFERTFEAVDEKGIDFWQTQMQMACHRINKTLYVISEPPKSINKYLYAEDIWELFEDFKKECAISFHIIEASPIHQEALIKRIEIAENVIESWLKDTSLNMREILFNELDNQKQLLKEEVITLSKTAKKEAVAEEKKKDEAEAIKKEIAPVIKEKEIEKPIETKDKTIILEIPTDIPF